jgi:hypothetical protein
MWGILTNGQHVSYPLQATSPDQRKGWQTLGYKLLAEVRKSQHDLSFTD